MDDATIKKLNEKLNSLDDNLRSEGAIDFYKILEKNPGLADNPTYKPYVDAFMEKILNDPSAMVRQAGLLAMETGQVKHPSANVSAKIQQMSQGNSLFGVEASAAKAAMDALANPAPSSTPSAEGSIGGALPGTPGGAPSGNAALASATAAAGAAATQNQMQQIRQQAQPQQPVAQAQQPPQPQQPPRVAAPAAQRFSGKGRKKAKPGQRLNVVSKQSPHFSGENGFNANAGTIANNNPGQRLNLIQGGQ